MISELFIYGRKDSIFKSICAQLEDIEDRYHVSPNYGHDLNTTNLQTFIKDEKYGLQDTEKKYPICVCVTPRSIPVMINGYRWEQFFFSLFFLRRTGYDENGMTNVDADTQLTTEEEPDTWSAMKIDAINFLNLLEATLKGTITIDSNGVPFKTILNFDIARPPTIRRLSNFNNNNISGVQLDLSLYLSIAACTATVEGIEYIVSTLLPEKDPVWLSDKTNYYTKAQINSLLADPIDLTRIIENEEPIGVIDGSNAIFATEFDFIPETVAVTINGLEQKPNVHFYTQGTNTVIFYDSPEVGDNVLVDYIKQ